MDELSAYFRETEHGLEPLPFASSGWAANMINGPAMCAVLARALEKDHGADGFVPARITVDLFSPAQFEPLTITTAQIRRGNRIRVADATACQGGKPVARASAVFLKASEQPPGERWVRPEVPYPPTPEFVAATKHATSPVWHSDQQAHWSDVIAEHQNAGRKRNWQRPLNSVIGDPPSQFVRAVVAGEITSMLTNWGTDGIAFINADLTLALARLPIGHEIGVEADNHVAVDGVAIGSATLYDRHGVFGTGLITALANAGRTISFESSAGMPEALRERYQRINQARHD
jgi:hypothetical protein